MGIGRRALGTIAGLALAGVEACGSDDPVMHDVAPTPGDARDGGVVPSGLSDGGAVGPVGTFPRDFLFGSAIAGFQVDMGCPTVAAEICEDRAADWYQYITTPRIVDNALLFMSKDPPSSGPGFYELYEQDLDRAAGTANKELANQAFRLSIEWSRIFPKATWGTTTDAQLRALASPEGLAYYHRLFAAMKRRGLRPFVTLNHYTLPLWVHDANACNISLPDCIAAGVGGWADPNRGRIVNEIAKYASFVAKEFGGEVDDWVTLNEPFSAVVIAGYVIASPARSNPPGLTGPFMSAGGAKTAATAMIEAHARMYDAVKSGDRQDADGDGRSAQVGMVYAYSEIVPNSPSAEDQKAADDARYFFEDMFMDGVAEGRLDANWDLGPGKAPVRADLTGRLDFVGVNYYFRFRARPGFLPTGFVSPLITFDMLQPFEPAPRGIEVALRRAAKYGLPLYVTETGTPQESELQGAAWMVQTLEGVRNAIRDGLDVRGYFAWSLMDNYEWNHGMHMRFGLYAVDEDKRRRPRASGELYGRMARERDVPADLSTMFADYFPLP